MDQKRFWSILGIGIALVVIQGISSWFDGYFTQSQMRSRGITNGWAFIEHGGMWADVFVISPILAYAGSKYQLNYFSKWGVVILFVAVVVALAMGVMYERNGMVIPEAHTHDGMTTFAGWIHGLFAVAAIWTIALAYLSLTTPPMSRADTIAFSLLLTPFFYLGVAKFSERWVFDSFAKRQVAIEIAGLWLLTGVRLWYT